MFRSEPGGLSCILERRGASRIGAKNDLGILREIPPVHLLGHGFPSFEGLTHEPVSLVLGGTLPIQGSCTKHLGVFIHQSLFSSSDRFMSPPWPRIPACWAFRRPASSSEYIIKDIPPSARAQFSSVPEAAGPWPGPGGQPYPGPRWPALPMRRTGRRSG